PRRRSWPQERRGEVLGRSRKRAHGSPPCWRGRTLSLPITGQSSECLRPHGHSRPATARSCCLSMRSPKPPESWSERLERSAFFRTDELLRTSAGIALKPELLRPVAVERY